MDNLFHQLAYVMSDVHRLSQLYTAGLQARPEEMTAAIDATYDSMMTLLGATSDFRNHYVANIRIARYNERMENALAMNRVRHVRRQREALAIRNAALVVEVAEPPDEVGSDAGSGAGSGSGMNVPIRQRKPKSKVVKQTELDDVMPDVCGICLEQYTRANSVSTCCGHSFCSSCYTTAVEHASNKPQREERVMKCPMCRKVSPKLTVFRARKKPVCKPQIETPESNDVVLVVA